MTSIIVTDNPEQTTFTVSGVGVVSAKDYLVLPEYSNTRNMKVYNLCKSYKNRTDGYYVSILAEAREHTVFPSAQTIQETLSLPLVRLIIRDIDDDIQKSLQHIKSEHCSFYIYFGKTSNQNFESLARKIFRLFPSPFLRVAFEQQNNKWNISEFSLLSPGEIPSQDRDYAVKSTQKQVRERTRLFRRRIISNYRLAILLSETEELPPSDPKAIAHFESAAEKIGFKVEIIGEKDYGRLSEFDALFIRETTNVNHYTFRFSQRAEADGLVVIDDPVSILRCSNKVYLAERLGCHGILTPKTVIIGRENRDSAIRVLGYPVILKAPDGSFSQGVKKVVNHEDFLQKSDIMFEKSDLIIAQEFVPTEYDWRIGIINNEVIYACRYYMAKEHWQIVNWQNKGGVRVGKWDCVPLRKVPSVVLKTALRAAKVIGDGLYGVDLKLIGKKCYVIEVNDNPSIETGVEDILLKDTLYLKIMRTMYERVKMKKERKVYKSSTGSLPLIRKGR